jgi:mono/diheme cytochrome c family protein
MRGVLILGVVATVLAIVGCGGGDGSPDTGVSTSTPATVVNGGPPRALHLNVPSGDQAGKHLVATSGCLACHRIGDSGNRHLGPNLTRIGTRMSREEILSALKAGPGIMPSFQNLGERRLDEMTSFLAHLK